MLKNTGLVVAVEVASCEKVNESLKLMPEITKVISCKKTGLGVACGIRQQKGVHWICTVCLITAIDRTISQSAIASMVVPKAGCSGRPCILEDPIAGTGKEGSFGLNLHVFLGKPNCKVNHLPPPSKTKI